MGLSQEQRDIIASESQRIKYLEQIDDWTEFDREMKARRRVEALMLIIVTLLIAAALLIVAGISARTEPNHRPQAVTAPTDGFRMASWSVGGRPNCCPPRAWCGCALSVWIYGDCRKSLWRARAWLNLGHPVPYPIPGAIAVYKRGSGGHVGIITSVPRPGFIVLKSGNDNGAVRERERSTAGVLGYRVL